MSNPKKKYTSGFIRTPKPVFQGGLGVFNWGDENIYPNWIKDMMTSSPSALQAWGLNSDYVSGTPYDEVFTVNNIHNYTNEDLKNRAAQDVSFMRGFAVHVDYNLNYEPARLKPIPIEWIRVGAKDDNGLYQKIVINEDWTRKSNSSYFNRAISWMRGNGRATQNREFDVYNPDKTVVRAQIAFAGGLAMNATDQEIRESNAFSKYKGQIFFVHMSRPDTYPLSQLHASTYSMDSETENEIARNSQVKKGFQANHLIVKKTDPQYIASLEDEDDEYSEIFDDDVDVMLDAVGSANKGSVTVTELGNIQDSVRDFLAVHTLRSETDVEGQRYADEKARTNIHNAFDNPPDPLLDSGESLFGTSGEALQQYRDFYNDQTLKKRSFVEKNINILMEGLGQPTQLITPLYQLDDTANNTSGAGAEQATD